MNPKRAGVGVVSGEATPVNVDDLADRLIEKRERLQYFIVTASAAVLLFSMGLLSPPHRPLGTAGRWATGVAGVLLLAAAGVALAGILYRHHVYAEYIDELSGKREANPTANQATRRRFALMERFMIALFFGGFVVLAVVDGVRLLWP